MRSRRWNRRLPRRSRRPEKHDYRAANWNPGRRPRHSRADRRQSAGRAPAAAQFRRRRKRTRTGSSSRCATEPSSAAASWRRSAKRSAKSARSSSKRPAAAGAPASRSSRRIADRARELGFVTLCAFTHQPAHFIRLGFSIVPHVWVPEKIAHDCVGCAAFRTCGQYAVSLPLRVGAGLRLDHLAQPPRAVAPPRASVERLRLLPLVSESIPA